MSRILLFSGIFVNRNGLFNIFLFIIYNLLFEFLFIFLLDEKNKIKFADIRKLYGAFIAFILIYRYA